MGGFGLIFRTRQKSIHAVLIRKWAADVPVTNPGKTKDFCGSFWERICFFFIYLFLYVLYLFMCELFGFGLLVLWKCFYKSAGEKLEVYNMAILQYSVFLYLSYKI